MSTEPTTPERPRYSLVMTCGVTTVPALPVKVVDITPSELTADAIFDRLQEAGVAVADVKTDFLLAFGSDDPVRNLVVYTALVGFCGRHADVVVDGRLLPTAALERKVRRAADAGAPTERPLVVQVGRTGRTDLVEIPFEDLSDPRALSLVRAAKRARLVPAGDALLALQQLVALAALRTRGNEERWPMVVVGDEEAPTAETASSPVGIDLERIRRESVTRRRTARSDDRSALVDAVEPSAALDRLQRASQVPVEVALQHLGVAQDEEDGSWACPRTEGHLNGTLSAAIRASKGKARCNRCDTERLDALRLVMTLTLRSPDEAADWLLGLPVPAPTVTDVPGDEPVA
jgi:hypothetical protein